MNDMRNQSQTNGSNYWMLILAAFFFPWVAVLLWLCNSDRAFGDYGTPTPRHAVFLISKRHVSFEATRIFASFESMLLQCRPETHIMRRAQRHVIAQGLWQSRRHVPSSLICFACLAGTSW